MKSFNDRTVVNKWSVASGGEHANHYTTNAIDFVYEIAGFFYIVNIDIKLKNKSF
jgi:hypothetical protein